MAPPTYSGKKSALPEMQARGIGVNRDPDDVFKAFWEEKVDEVWEGIEEDENAQIDLRDVMKEIKRMWICKHYGECEEGLGRREEGKPILQIIATFQSPSNQEYYNFGDFRFNNCTEEEMKAFAIEEFDAEFKDIIKISCEYRYNEDPECPYPDTPVNRRYDAVAPQWFKDEHGKCWWHVNTCEECGAEFVDATNPPRCGHCVAGTTPEQ